MRKILILFTFLIFVLTPVKAAVMDLSGAIAQNSSKPMAVLLYADWADGYQNALTQFRKAEKDMASTYNFVELNIASKSAKLYNANYVIYPNLPYVMLFRDNAKFSFIIRSDCLSNSSCINDKMSTFLR